MESLKKLERSALNIDGDSTRTGLHPVDLMFQ